MTTIHSPADAREVLELVRSAVADEVPAEIVGTGTKRALGRPMAVERRIALHRLSGIVDYEPEELVLTAAAGTPLREIEAALAERRQMMAFEPIDYGPLLGGEPGAGTIGGLLACNLAGPRRVKMGAARDHFLGAACVTGRGEAVKTGGKVVKNVTGYDLCKLLAGSWGTLTVMTEVTIKVLPAPEDVRTLLLHRLDDRAAVAAMTVAMQSAHEVSGAAHLPADTTGDLGMARVSGAGTAVTALRLEGFGPSVRARVQALGAELAAFGDGTELDAVPSRALWRSIRDVEAFSSLWDRPVWRLSVPPAAGAEVAEAIRTQVDCRILFDWAGGLLWVAPVAEPGSDLGQAAIRLAVSTSGGHATLIRASAEYRDALDVFQPPAAGAAALSRRVKEAFDPTRILNRGRMYRDV
ncbi:glycolate oxidase FAD binding subunit [Constrictibacter sp. MBR-5]|jgi:glycolate oxidase FAD binding subunit|uniref:glycolate oxidase subunit GlcE n=1 Tax=Constrictibacter sp. MBR-5 TaxID=3156467 RepID=UPI003396A933